VAVAALLIEVQVVQVEVVQAAKVSLLYHTK
jgi:hypothetical protein